MILRRREACRLWWLVVASGVTRRVWGARVRRIDAAVHQLEPIFEGEVDFGFAGDLGPGVEHLAEIGERGCSLLLDAIWGQSGEGTPEDVDGVGACDDFRAEPARHLPLFHWRNRGPGFVRI